MQTKNTGFRSDINGLRAIAVIAVVLYHFGVKGFSGGFAGVDIFFVISGFLMTGIIFRQTDNGKFSLIGFYLARAKRIIPALAFLCLSLLAAGWFVLIPSEYKELGKHAAASIGFLSNVAYWREAGYFDTASHGKWLLHTWSLSVEWQFYIIYPLIVLAARKLFGTSMTKVLLVVGALVSFALCLYMSSRSPSAAFYLLPTRAWEMLAGGIVFLFPMQMKHAHRKVASVFGLAMIALSILMLDASDVWPGWLALIPVAGTALLILTADQTSVVTNNKLSASIGKASYSIYLWHWPMVVLLGYYGVSDSTIAIAAGVAASILLGYASLHFVETPFQKLNIKVAQRPHLASYVLVVLIIGACASAVFVKQGVESRVSKIAAQADSERTNKNPASKECFIETGVDSPKCIFGKKDAPVSVIVMGDSHSDAIVSAVVEAAGPEKSTLYLGYISCMTIPGMKLQGMPSSYQCGDFVRKEIEELKTTLPGVPLVVINRSSVYVFGHNEYQDRTTGPLMYFNEPGALDEAYKEDFRKRYVSAMCEIAKNRPVYVTKPIPEMIKNVPTTIARNEVRFGKSQDVTIPLSEYKSRNQFVLSVMEDAAKSCGIQLLDPEPELCDAQYCYGSINGKPLYWDDNHMSESGNKKLIPVFRSIWN
jgi:peptidoglycan/LPS O-acetylase OafA/YrhL